MAELGDGIGNREALAIEHPMRDWGSVAYLAMAEAKLDHRAEAEKDGADKRPAPQAKDLGAGKHHTLNVVGKELTCHWFHLFERFRIRCAQHATFGDDSRDVFGRGHVEGRVADAHTVGRHLLAGVVRHFPGRALLDGDLVAGGGGEVERVPVVAVPDPDRCDEEVGEASADDVISLARTVRDGVCDVFGVTLTPEPVLVGCSF